MYEKERLMQVVFLDLNQGDLLKQLYNTYGKYTAVDDNLIACRWESKKVIDLSQNIQDKLSILT